MRNLKSLTKKLFLNLLLVLMIGCAGPNRKPETQFMGSVQGAMTGAASGAMTGFHLGIGAGPAALAGAGVGALAGGMQGYAHDVLQEKNEKLQKQINKEEERAKVHQILRAHYEDRLRLSPSREIYPADTFFFGDERKICRDRVPLVTEISKLTKERMPWSRFAVTAYVKSADEDSEFAKDLAESRAKEISNYLIKAGIEPRRVVARGVIVPNEVIVDPTDKPGRYSQAIEFSLLDR